MHKLLKSKSGRAMGWSAIVFLVGLGLAVIGGLLSGLGILELKSVIGLGIPTVLVIIGGIIGFANIESDEAVKMLLVALIMSGGSGVVAYLGVFGKILTPVFTNFIYLSLPAGLIVGVKTFLDIAKN